MSSGRGEGGASGQCPTIHVHWGGPHPCRGCNHLHRAYPIVRELGIHGAKGDRGGNARKEDKERDRDRLLVEICHLSPPMRPKGALDIIHNPLADIARPQRLPTQRHARRVGPKWRLRWRGRAHGCTGTSRCSAHEDGGRLEGFCSPFRGSRVAERGSLAFAAVSTRRPTNALPGTATGLRRPSTAMPAPRWRGSCLVDDLIDHRYRAAAAGAPPR